jgi:hypothetical protein
LARWPKTTTLVEPGHRSRSPLLRLPHPCVLCKGGNSAPAAILKSGTRGEKLFRDRRFIPFLFAKNNFWEAKVAIKIEKMAKIKLLICNELQIWEVKARVVKSLCG